MSLTILYYGKSNQARRHLSGTDVQTKSDGRQGTLNLLELNIVPIKF